MEQGKVYSKLLSQLKEEAGQLFLIIDPPNQSPKEAGKIAKIAENVGASAIGVGGSLALKENYLMIL